MGFSDKLAARVHNATKKSLTESFVFLDKTDDQEYTIKGFYNQNHEIVDPETEMIISSDEVAIDIILADLPIAPDQNDELTRVDSGAIYIIKDLEFDGQGAVSLIVFEKIV